MIKMNETTHSEQSLLLGLPFAVTVDKNERIARLGHAFRVLMMCRWHVMSSLHLFVGFPGRLLKTSRAPKERRGEKGRFYDLTDKRLRSAGAAGCTRAVLVFRMEGFGM